MAIQKWQAGPSGTLGNTTGAEMAEGFNQVVDNTLNLYTIATPSPVDVDLQLAIDSGAKRITSINPVVITGVLKLDEGQALEYINFSGNGSIVLVTGCTAYQCEFDGINLGLDFTADNAQVVMNSFINGAYINSGSGSNRGAKNVKISLNITTDSPLLFATSINDSQITCNDVNATGSDFSISFFGSDNEVTNNDIDAGTTGIILIPTRSVNQRAKAFNNKIERNKVKNSTEEGISFDVRGNSATDGLCVASTTVSSGSASSIQFSNVFPAYQQLSQFVVWQDGKRKGQQHRIIYAGGAGLGLYELEGYTYQASDVGANVTVQLGAHGNVIAFNEVVNSTLAGIKVWGGFLHSSICDNILIDCDLEVESLSGLTSSVSASSSSPHYTEICRNTCNDGLVVVDKVEYSGTAIEPIGMSIYDNSAESVSVNTAEDPRVKGKNTTSEVSSSEYFPNGSKTISKFFLLTNAVDEEVYSISLKKTFGSSLKIRVTVGATQCSATQEFIVCAYRSNETTSKYGANTGAGTLYNISANSGQRNISAITVTPTVTSTTTFNDEAVLSLDLNVTLSGSIFGPTDTCNVSVEVEYMTSGRGE